jgi:hypothetical protein
LPGYGCTVLVGSGGAIALGTPFWVRRTVPRKGEENWSRINAKRLRKARDRALSGLARRVGSLR